MVILKLSDSELRPEHLDKISENIVDCATKVHTELGPGLPEKAYETCLAYELEKHGHTVERQVQMGVTYDEIVLDIGFKIDLLVDSAVIVELKAVEDLLPIHSAQVLTYLRLSNHRLGLLLNFNVALFEDGIKRIVR